MYNYLNYLIKAVIPNHLQEDVRLNQPVKVYFTEPIDASTVNDANIWVIKDSLVQRVPGVVSYVAKGGEFYIQFTPSSGWEANSTYRVTMRGESQAVTNISDINEGIKTMLGKGFAGDYYWTFTTGDIAYLNKVILSYPSNKIAHIGNPHFEWNPVANASTYDVVISKTPSFENNIYYTNTTDTGIFIPMQLDDRIEYWWRVRAVDADGNTAQWSDVWSFYKGDPNDGYITPEDMPYNAYPLVDFYTDNTKCSIERTLPMSDTYNVNVNLNYIAIDINGYIDPYKLNNDNIKLVGIPMNANVQDMDGQCWWEAPVISTPDALKFLQTNMTPDIMRNIIPHGNVPLNIQSMYDPVQKKTIVVGTMVNPVDINNDYIFKQQKVMHNYTRVTPIGNIDGYNREFYIPTVPLLNSLAIYVDGKITNAYTSNGRYILFNEAPQSDSKITAIYISGYLVVEKLNGVQNNLNKIFTTSIAPTVGTLVINKNGFDLLYNVDYTVSDNVVTFTDSLLVEDKLFVKYYITSPYIVNDIPTGNVDGVNRIFLLHNTPYKDTEQISVNGLLLERVTDYTITGNVITFVNPVAVNSTILAKYFLHSPMIVNEIPSGAANGINRVFTTNCLSNAATLDVFVDGELISDDDYYIEERNIIFHVAPANNSRIRCNYYVKGMPAYSLPEGVGLNFLLPNNKYCMLLNIDSLKYSGWFTSQYWPIFATVNDVRYELGDVAGHSDHELYYHIRESSIEAAFMVTSPMNYTIKTTQKDATFTQMLIYGPIFPQQMLFGPLFIPTILFNPTTPMQVPFDPNHPSYPIYMYTKLKAAYDVIAEDVLQNSLMGGGEKTLGDFIIKRGSITPAAAKLLMEKLTERLQPWKDMLLGHNKKGQMVPRWAIRGINNYNQYNSDYPLKTRMHSTRRIYEYPQWPMVQWNKWGKTL